MAHVYSVRRFHMLAFLSAGGAAFSLCAMKNPEVARPINIRRASWTSRATVVTCSACKRLIAQPAIKLDEGYDLQWESAYLNAG